MINKIYFIYLVYYKIFFMIKNKKDRFGLIIFLNIIQYIIKENEYVNDRVYQNFWCNKILGENNGVDSWKRKVIC